MLLYVLTNTVNGKKYVGKTVSNQLNRYLAVKRWQATHGNPGNMPVVAAIAKYGWDSFQADVLAKVDDEELLNEIERVWIADLGTQHPEFGYNLQEGGGTGRLGLRNSEEHNRKIGLANKGRKPKGYIRTDAHRRQRSEAMLGNKLGVKITPELRARWNASMTPEQRKERGKKAAEARWKKEANNVTSG